MKRVIRHQSLWLLRRSFKPIRAIRIPAVARLNIVFRPANRFGVKPQLEIAP
jgi:hypothetical protein